MSNTSAFNPSEHLQDLLRKTHNDQVKDFFADFDRDNIDPDITTPRASLRTACLITDKDNWGMIQARLSLFYYTLRQAQDLQAPVYGEPIGLFNEQRKYRPQIYLHFKEPLDEVEAGFHPLEARITFRLMNETETSLTTTELTSLANRIKQEFGANFGYKWKKGKTLCNYVDPPRGYSLQIYAYSITEGKEVIGKILDIQNHSPEWSKLTVSENDRPTEAYPVMPPIRNILGKQVREPRRRPVGNVQFTHATCQIWGLQKPVALIDLRGRLLNTLVQP